MSEGEQLDLEELLDGKPKTKPKKAKKSAAKLTKVQSRAIKTATQIEMEPVDQIGYQHSVLCQTSLPFRNPGDSVREWERRQGAVHLLVEAGSAKDPELDEFVKLGLPFGPKPRLILAHLNAQALKTGEPVIEMDDSLTAFVKRIQGREPNGKEFRAFKDHLGRLAAATIRMAVSKDGRAVQVDSKIVTAFDLWLPKNDKQRVLWPSTIQLSADYFNSLQKHAVPLDERAMGALAQSSMALDLYAWLAQRLHRIPENQPQFITWKAIKDQFGQGYGRMNNFKGVFRTALTQVLIQYQAARIDEDGQGLTLWNSPPPVPKKLFLVRKPVNE
jgi:hypothetical protein